MLARGAALGARLRGAPRAMLSSAAAVPALEDFEYSQPPSLPPCDFVPKPYDGEGAQDARGRFLGHGKPRQGRGLAPAAMTRAPNGPLGAAAAPPRAMSSR
mmetsp:Transcript_20748/g.64355  ORF Transcript_20748/g.64355 Transcript_20748/m.64355 type:complete len:101 (-) Transcript_20748:2398-2700(-)